MQRLLKVKTHPGILGHVVIKNKYEHAGQPIMQQSCHMPFEIAFHENVVRHML